MRTKVTILGEEKSGKTCLIHRLLKRPVTESYEPTIGASFYQTAVRIDDQKALEVIIDIWDTSGADRYYALIPMYTRNCNSTLIVLNSQKELAHNKELLIKYLDLLKKNAANGIPVIFYLSHQDEENKIKTTPEQITELLNGKECEEFQKTFALGSATSHSAIKGDSIETLFQTLVEEIYFSERPRINMPEEIILYCELLLKRSEIDSKKDFTEKILLRLENHAQEGCETAKLIKNLIYAGTRSEYAMTLYNYLSPLRSSYPDKIYWDLGNDLYHTEHYQEAIEILKRILYPSEFHQDAWLIMEACKRSAKGYRHYSWQDLKPNPDMEPTAIRIQELYRSRVCFFSYQKYKAAKKKIGNLTQQLNDHIAHGKIPDAQNTAKKLEEPLSTLAAAAVKLNL